MFDFEDELFTRHNPQKYSNQSAFNTSALNPWHRTQQYFNIKQKHHISQKPLKPRKTTTSYVKRSQQGFRLNQFGINDHQEKDQNILNFLIKRKKSHQNHLKRVNMAKTLSLNNVSWNNISTTNIEGDQYKIPQKLYQKRAKTNSMQRTKQNINYHGNGKTFSIKREKVLEGKFISNVHEIRRRLLSNLETKKQVPSPQKLEKLVNLQNLKNIVNVAYNSKTLDLIQGEKQQQKVPLQINQKRKKVKSLYIGYQKFFNSKQKSVFRPIHGLKRSNNQDNGQLVNLNNFQIKRFEIKSIARTNSKLSQQHENEFENEMKCQQQIQISK